MYEDILREMRNLVRRNQIIIPYHAIDEASDDGSEKHDIEQIIYTGFIRIRQIDRETKERKYVIRGETTDGRLAEVVAKIIKIGTRKVVIITTYEV